MRMELDILPLPPSHQLHPQKVFFFSVTPGKNKLFRKNEFRTNGRLHENLGVKLFSQLQDERILSSKQGPSYTGVAKPPNLPKNWQIWWFGWACVAQSSKDQTRMQKYKK